MNGGARSPVCGWTALVLLAAVAWLLAPRPAPAQQVVGGTGGSGVTVDYGVLESLGPPPNIASELLGVAPGATVSPYARTEPRFPVVRDPSARLPSNRIVLTPPDGRKKAAPTPRARPRMAAKPPAPPAPNAAAAAPPKPAKAKPASPPQASKPSAKKPAAPAAPAPLAPPPPVGDLPPPPEIAALPPPPPIPEAPAAPAPEPPRQTPAASPSPSPPPSSSAPQAERPAPAEPARTAALPPATTGRVASGDRVRVVFEPGSAKLNEAANAEMDRVAEAMKADDALRIQLLAYAGGSVDSASQARRLSLSRALAARSYLIGQGVRSTRIDVRALGNRLSDGPPDRVDIMVVKR